MQKCWEMCKSRDPYHIFGDFIVPQSGEDHSCLAAKIKGRITEDLFKPHPDSVAPDVKRNIALVDLDGTLLEFDRWRGMEHYGDPIPGAIEGLKMLKQMGLIVIIWTTRGDRESVKKALDGRGFAGLYDHINENPYQPPDASQKIMGTVAIDDRAVAFRGNWAEAIEKTFSLLVENPLR